MTTAILGVGFGASGQMTRTLPAGEPAGPVAAALLPGFGPRKAGGAAAAGRIEAPSGDLHQYGFNGEVTDIDRARSATAGSGA